MSKVLLISYDNGSHLPFFPINIFYLLGALQKKGHQVGVWFQDIHHGDEKALTQILDGNKFDIVGLGFCAGYWQYEKVKKISAAVNVSKNRKTCNYVLGGHGPAGDPKFFMEKMGADSVVVGDGERAICQIAERGQRGAILGDPAILDEAPLDCYKYFPMDLYRLIRWPTSQRTDFCFPILSSRGCKWNCSFCYRMRDGFFERSTEAIIEEIKYLHDNFHINHFQFADELLMSSVKRTEEICEAILHLPFSMKWDCNGRLNFAEKRILDLMKKSGCSYVNYGIESLNQEILNEMKKGLKVDQIYQGVEATLTSGISPGLNFIWGFPGDTEENLFKCVEFICKYDPCDELRTIRPVTPYPACPLWLKALEGGLVKDTREFYENLHKNSDLLSINFMDIPIEEAHRMLWSANRDLIRNYLNEKHIKMLDGATKLYLVGDTSFRGFRAV